MKDSIRKTKQEADEYYAEVLSERKRYLFPFSDMERDDPIYRLRTAIVRKQIADLGSEDSLLTDLGCSDGFLILTLPNRNEKIGIDFVQAIVRKANSARLHLSRLETNFIVCEASNLCLRDNTSHVLVCSEVLEHVPEPKMVLREIYRVLTPDGCLIVTLPTIGILSYLYHLLAKTETSALYRSPRHLREYAYWRSKATASLLTFIRDLNETGYKTLSIDNLGIVFLSGRFGRLREFLHLLQLRISRRIPYRFGFLIHGISILSLKKRVELKD